MIGLLVGLIVGLVLGFIAGVVGCARYLRDILREINEEEINAIKNEKVFK